MKNQKVYCNDCVFLEQFGGIYCHATSKTVLEDTPFEQQLKMVEIKSCFYRNKHNNCKYFKETQSEETRPYPESLKDKSIQMDKTDYKPWWKRVF